MSERLPDETPRHLRRYVPPPMGIKGRLHPEHRIGVWAIAANVLFFIVAAVLVLGR